MTITAEPIPTAETPSAVTMVPAPRQPLLEWPTAVPVAAEAFVETAEKRRRPLYRSGWCGSGPECGDMRIGPTGEPKRHCRGFCRNGEKATHPIVYCACTCHPRVPAAEI